MIFLRVIKNKLNNEWPTRNHTSLQHNKRNDKNNLQAFCIKILLKIIKKIIIKNLKKFAISLGKIEAIRSIILKRLP